MIRFIPLFLAFALGHATAAHGECENLFLPFEPYSSTYLPNAMGRLTNIYKDEPSIFKSPKPQIEMTREQFDTWSNMTLMQKLDALNLYILSKKTNHQQDVHKSHYIKGAPGWWGYCDQWASASLDPDVNAYINASPEATICGNLVITKGEIKEMFTGFYPARGRRSKGRVEHRFSVEEEWVLTEGSGDDVYSAKDFDQDIRSSLKNGTGIVLNTTKSGEIWNYPVFNASRCEQALPLDAKTVGELEPCLLEAKDRDVNLWLQDVCDTDRLALKRVQDSTRMENSPDLTDNAKALALQLKVLNSKLSNRKESAPFSPYVAEANQAVERSEGSMAWARGSSRTLIERLARADIIQPKDLGLQVSRITNTIAAGSETHEFAPTQTRKHLRQYSYLLIKNSKGEVIASKWETEVKKRPGYSTLPFKNNPIGWGDPLRDLIEVLNRCKEFPEFRTQNLESLKLIQESIQGAAVPM